MFPDLQMETEGLFTKSILQVERCEEPFDRVVRQDVSGTETIGWTKRFARSLSFTRFMLVTSASLLLP